MTLKENININKIFPSQNIAYSNKIDACAGDEVIYAIECNGFYLCTQGHNAILKKIDMKKETTSVYVVNTMLNVHHPPFEWDDIKIING